MLVPGTNNHNNSNHFHFETHHQTQTRTKLTNTHDTYHARTQHHTSHHFCSVSLASSSAVCSLALLTIHPNQPNQTCTGTCRAATHTTMATPSTGTRDTCRRAAPSIGTSVTLLSVLLFANISPLLLASSWSAVAMPVISPPLRTSFSVSSTLSLLFPFFNLFLLISLFVWSRLLFFFFKK